MINKVIIIGNLGAAPETRYTQAGTAVTTFNVACTEKWKGQDGQMQEQTEWVKCTAFAKLAEICGEYLAKGSRVYVEGRLKTDKWQDQNGNDRYSTGVILREMKMLSPKQGGNNQGGYQEPPSMGGAMGTGGMGDDVPFAPVF